MGVGAAFSATKTGAVVFLYGTLCALFVALFVYRSQSFVDSQIDLNGFGLISQNLAAGKGFTLGQGPTLRRAPLYPLLGAAALKGFGAPSTADRGAGAPGVNLDRANGYRPLIIANCVIFGLTCLTVWAATRRIFGSSAALMAALLCPIVPQSLRYVGMTEVETLMGLLLALLAYTGINLVERPRLATGAWFGLASAAATLTKPVTLFYPFLFVAWWACWAWWPLRTSSAGWAAWDSRRPRAAPLVASAAALACFALALAPWVARNLAVTQGQFVGISSNAPGEFLRGYINAQPKYYLLRQDFGGTAPSAIKWDAEANVYEEHLLEQHGSRFFRYNFDRSGRMVVVPDPGDLAGWRIETEKDRIELAEVKRRLLQEPLAFVRKFLIQMATFWYLVETRAKSILVGVVALFCLFGAALGVVRAHRQRLTIWPVVLVIVYVNAFYAAILAFARYSMPIYPTLLILVAGGLEPIVAAAFRTRS
jgi:4-amino-4-deoxy-L-arabinose transferase-like glycosyltransferase